MIDLLMEKTLNGGDPETLHAKKIIINSLKPLGIEGNLSLLKFFVAAPWVCHRQIEIQIETSVIAWTEGNNSGNSDVYTAGIERQHAIHRRLDRLFGLIDVKVDWGVGLYPVFKFQGRNHLTLTDLWLSILECRLTGT